LGERVSEGRERGWNRGGKKGRKVSISDKTPLAPLNNIHNTTHIP